MSERERQITSGQDMNPEEIYIYRYRYIKFTLIASGREREQSNYVRRPGANGPVVVLCQSGSGPAHVVPEATKCATTSCRASSRPTADWQHGVKGEAQQRRRHLPLGSWPHAWHAHQGRPTTHQQRCGDVNKHLVQLVPRGSSPLPLTAQGHRYRLAWGGAGQAQCRRCSRQGGERRGRRRCCIARRI